MFDSDGSDLGFRGFRGFGTRSRAEDRRTCLRAVGELSAGPHVAAQRGLGRGCAARGPPRAPRAGQRPRPRADDLGCTHGVLGLPPALPGWAGDAHASWAPCTRLGPESITLGLPFLSSRLPLCSSGRGMGRAL